MAFRCCGGWPALPQAGLMPRVYAIHALEALSANAAGSNDDATDCCQHEAMVAVESGTWIRSAVGSPAKGHAVTVGEPPTWQVASHNVFAEPQEGARFGGFGDALLPCAQANAGAVETWNAPGAMWWTIAIPLASY